MTFREFVYVTDLYQSSHFGRKQQGQTQVLTRPCSSQVKYQEGYCKGSERKTVNSFYTLHLCLESHVIQTVVK